jgi:hypothetical protein
MEDFKQLPEFLSNLQKKSGQSYRFFYFLSYSFCPSLFPVDRSQYAKTKIELEKQEAEKKKQQKQQLQSSSSSSKQQLQSSSSSSKQQLQSSSSSSKQQLQSSSSSKQQLQSSSSSSKQHVVLFTQQQQGHTTKIQALPTDLKSLTVPQLKEKIKDLSLKLPTKLVKDNLVAVLERARQNCLGA